MSQSYQAGMTSGAAPGHPAQKPSVTADQGITETANARPDIASNKDTSHLTDNKGDANVPPNPAEVKAETGHDGAAPTEVDPDIGEEGDAVRPPDGVEYPEQKHAGKVGLGPAYAETHGAVTLGEKLAGWKQEVKGKFARNPETVEKGREMVTGEAKKKKLEQDAAPSGVAKPGDAKKAPSVAKGAEGDKPIAETAAAEEKKTGASEPTQEAEQKSGEAKSDASQQPQDISHPHTSGAEKAEVDGVAQAGDVHPNPPAPHRNTSQQSQGTNQPPSSATGKADMPASGDAGIGDVHPNPPAPHQNSQQSQSTDEPPSSGTEKVDVAVSSGGCDVHSNPPASHQGMSS